MTDTFVSLTAEKLIELDWAQLEPYYAALEKADLSKATITSWLKNWTKVSDVRDELYNRLYVATSVNTTDAVAQKRFDYFMEKTYPQVMAAEQKLKEKLSAHIYLLQEQEFHSLFLQQHLLSPLQEKQQKQ